MDNTLWACGQNCGGSLAILRIFQAHLQSKYVTGAKCRYRDFGHVFSKNRQYAVGERSKFEGELGNGDRNSISTPTQINMDNVIDIQPGATYGGYSLFLKADSTLWASGNNANGALGNGTTVSQIIPIKVMTNVKSMSAGATHSLVLKTDGTLWGFGK